MDLGHDESERMRIRDQEWSNAASRRDKDRVQGSLCVVGQTTSPSGGTYPTAANRFYPMTTVALSGTEVEGGAGTLTTQGDLFFAYNFGSAVPPSGANIICTFLDFWSFRYDG